MFKEISENRSVEDFDAGRNKALSPVADTALQMLQEASQTQQDFRNRIERGGHVAFQPTNLDIVRSLSPRERRLYNITYTALIFGSLLPELEASLVNGYFSETDFGSRYDLAVRGTFHKTWNIPTGKVEVYEDSQKKTKRFQLAKEDSSFSSFFKGEGIELLPQFALEKLHEGPFLLAIQHEILVPYKEIVSIRSRR